MVYSNSRISRWTQASYQWWLPQWNNRSKYQLLNWSISHNLLSYLENIMHQFRIIEAYTQCLQDQLKVLTWSAVWSNRVHSTSRLGELRAKEMCVNYQEPVFHHHGSQNTANVSPHLVFLLRQTRGLCGPIRSTPYPHGLKQTIRINCYKIQNIIIIHIQFLFNQI
jgi:hypothetical protein